MYIYEYIIFCIASINGHISIIDLDQTWHLTSLFFSVIQNY